MWDGFDPLATGASLMARHNDKGQITVVAENKVTSPEGTEIIKTFSASWARSMELPRPVTCEFTGFVRP